MCEIINLSEYKEKLEGRRKKTVLIDKMGTELTREEADYTVLQLLDLFCQKHQPDIYWRFDLFINDKME